jgi:hypothetical protein
LLGLLPLTFVTFVKNFLEDRTSTAWVTHVDIGPSQIELGSDLSHRTRIVQVFAYIFGAQS